MKLTLGLLKVNSWTEIITNLHDLSPSPFKNLWIKAFCLKSPWSQFHRCSTYSFYTCRSQKCKKDIQVVNLFTLSGSTSVKAECKTLVKLTPDWLWAKVHSLDTQEIFLKVTVLIRFFSYTFEYKGIQAFRIWPYQLVH